MKKYNKPAVTVVVINTKNRIMTGSSPERLNNSYSESEQLAPRSSLWGDYEGN